MSSSDLKVLVTIKPFHSIVSGIMFGVAEPILLLKGNSSPHSHSLLPSNAKKLQETNIIFWGGKNLEGFLEKPIKTLATGAKSVPFLETEGIIKLNLRKIIQTKKYNNQNENGDRLVFNKSREAGIDPHIWLDPQNAKKIAKKIIHVLSEFDPKNREKFNQNGEAYISRLDELNNKLKVEMKEISAKPYVVFHDAYQYFEKRYNLNIIGSLTTNVSFGASVRRLKKIQKIIKEEKIRCIFSEPQYSKKLVKTIVKGREIRIVNLDPLGVNLTVGPELYFNLINNIAVSFKRCLSG